MLDIHTVISTAAGDMATFVSRPADEGPHPVVFFYMDAPGKREELHDMARRIATTGYYVVLPQLYYRRIEEYSVQDSGDAARAEMFEHMVEQHLFGGVIIERPGECLKIVHHVGFEMAEFVHIDPAIDLRIAASEVEAHRALLHR